MKKTLDLNKMIQESEERAKKMKTISTDKEIKSEFLQSQRKLGQATEKDYSIVVRDLKK